MRRYRPLHPIYPNNYHLHSQAMLLIMLIMMAVLVCLSMLGFVILYLLRSHLSWFALPLIVVIVFGSLLMIRRLYDGP